MSVENDLTPSLPFAEAGIITPEIVLMLLTLSMQFCASHCFLPFTINPLAPCGWWWSHSNFPENQATQASQLAKGEAGIRTQIFRVNVYSFQHTQIPANPFVAIKPHFLPSLSGMWNSCSASPIIISLHMYESCDFVPFQLPLRQVKSPRFCSS